jgi:hypothetical protein
VTALRGKLIADQVHHDRRLGKTGRQLLAHQINGLIDVARQRAQAADDVLVILHRPRGHLVDDFEDLIVRAVHLGDALHEPQVGLGVELPPQLVLEQMGAQALRDGEVPGADIENLLQELVARDAGAIPGCLRPVTPPIVVFVAPDLRGKLRRLGEPELPVGGKLLVKARRRGADGGRRERRLPVLRGEREWCDDEDQKKSDSSHDDPGWWMVGGG